MSEQEDLSTGAAEDSNTAPGELVLLRAVTRRDQQELESLRDQLLTMTDTAGHALRRLTETERRLEQARAAIDVLEHSSSFRFGNALVRSVKSPRQLWQLPRTLWQIGRDLRRKGPVRHAETLVPEDELSTPLGDLPPALFAKTESFASARKAVIASAPMADLRVAAIMDEFTRACFMPTCRMQSLHAQHYEQQLLDNPPDLLFVESAWRGEADSWRNMIASRSGELLGLLDMCRRRNIPTAFWNKEDPAHFSTFLETARLFDHVFTTDIDSIRRYADALGHARVHLLPFASQPRLHNPLVAAPRKAGFSFAGSYYHRYPERCEDFDRLITTLARLGPVVIYDRNSERADPAFAFPKRFSAMLQPALPYDRIDEAYKGHRFAVNMNTVKQSQSMFARRVFELMACNTVVVSNYSRGMRSLFGDLVVCTDQEEVMRERLLPMVTSAQGTRRHRLLALRKVLSEHTYEHRMQQIARTVLEAVPALDNHVVLTVARVASHGELKGVLAAYERQLYPSRQLVMVVCAGLSLEAVPAGTDIRILRESDALAFRLDQVEAQSCIAVLHPADYYGPHYLSDLMLATRFSDAKVIGKGAHYQSRDGRVALVDGARYREGQPLFRRSSLARGSALAGMSLSAWLDAALSDQGETPLPGVAVDEFSYCRDGLRDAKAPIEVDVDGAGVDIGLSSEALLARAERLSRLLPRSRQRHREEASELNARPADFAACVAQNRRLFIVDEYSRWPITSEVVNADVFLCSDAITRSFAERSSIQLMQGSPDDLRDLLSNNAYVELGVAAPGKASCAVVTDYVEACSVVIYLRAADVSAADARTPWVGLLAQGFPRLGLAVDASVDVKQLWALIGTEFEANRWRVA